MSYFFFFNDTATTEIYTLSLHDALPIFSLTPYWNGFALSYSGGDANVGQIGLGITVHRSEEHTSELQSQSNLVCRLLLEKKKKIKRDIARVIDSCNYHVRHYIQRQCKL